MHRLDICRKHHEQRLCKLILALGKISHGEEISCVISKIFLKFLIKLIWFSEESKCFQRTVSENRIFGIQMQKKSFLGVQNVAVYAFFGYIFIFVEKRLV